MVMTPKEQYDQRKRERLEAQNRGEFEQETADIIMGALADFFGGRATLVIKDGINGAETFKEITFRKSPP